MRVLSFFYFVPASEDVKKLVVVILNTVDGRTVRLAIYELSQYQRENWKYKRSCVKFESCTDFLNFVAALLESLFNTTRRIYAVTVQARKSWKTKIHCFDEFTHYVQTSSRKHEADFKTILAELLTSSAFI